MWNITMYLWLLQAACKELYKKGFTYNVNMLVVETTPNFKCKSYKVTNAHIKQGLAELKELLTLVAEWKNKTSENLP